MAVRSCFARYVLAVFLCTFLFFLCSSVEAQSSDCVGSSKSVSATVQDLHGAMIPGATVIYTCGALRQQLVTDSNGSLQAQLSPGRYTVHVEAPGFQAVDREMLVPLQADPVQITISMVVKGNEDTVTISANGGPVISATDIGTRTETALRDIPQSLQIVPHEVIEQEQAHSMNDVLRNVAGVTIPWTSGGRYESITIRGFTTMNQFKDGFRNDSGSNHAPVELSNVERVEVLKGPSSTVFGRLDPSGVVNLVTRAPLNERLFTASLTSGSFQYNQLNLDWTGPVNPSKSLLYRVTASGLDTLSFRNYAYTKRGFIAPVFSWMATPSLSIRFYSEFLIQNSVNDQGLVAVGTRPANIPISTYLGDPTLTAPDRQGKAGVSVDKVLKNGWILRSYERSSIGVAVYNSRTAKSLAADNKTLSLNDFTSEQNFQTHYWINEAVGHVRSGPIDHTILAGFELDREINPNYQKQSTGAVPKLNIYAPNYAVLPSRHLVLNLSNNSTGDFGGGYVQDQAKLLNNLKVTGSIRYDIAKLVTDQYFPTITHTPQRNTAWSPRAGLVYQPVQEVSLYATYSKSFQPQTGVAFDGSAFEPMRGRLLETGVRFTSPLQRYAATISAYDITQTNVLTADPEHDNFSIAVGEQRSKGIDFDSTLQLTPGWNVIAGYAYDIPQVTKDNTYAVGNLLAGAPRHTENFWTHYTKMYGPLQGFGAGAGVFGAGKRFGDLTNDYLLPGYARVDGNVSYSRSLREKTKLLVNFNVQNVADRRYFEGGSTRFRLAPGTPRAFMGSIQFTR
jgi:iron complex outermembrane recepter protein